MKTPALLQIWLSSSGAYRLAYNRSLRRLIADDNRRGLTQLRFFWFYPERKQLRRKRFRKRMSYSRTFHKAPKRTFN